MDFTIGTIVYFLAGMTLLAILTTAIVSLLRTRKKTKNLDDEDTLNAMKPKLERDIPAEHEAPHPWAKTDDIETARR